MHRDIIRRLVFMVPTIIVTTMFTFGLLRIMPGDVIVAQMAESRGSDPALMEKLRQELGLDVPAPVQYVRWIGGIVTGDWGTSYWQNKPVSEVVGRALPISFELGFLAITIGLIIAALTVGDRPQTRPIGTATSVASTKPSATVLRLVRI